MESGNELHNESIVDLALADYEAGRHEAIHDAMVEMHPAEIANLLEALPPAIRKDFWSLLPAEFEGETLTFLHDEARNSILDQMASKDIVAAAEDMAVEDLVEVMESMPDDITDTIMDALDKDHRRRLETVQNYEEDTAGRLMSTDVISVRENVSLGVVLRWLRRHPTLPRHTDALMVITDDSRYLGKLEMADLVTGDPEDWVLDTMQTNAEVVTTKLPAADLARLFERRDLISVAVIDDNEHLMGRITIDDIVDVIRDEADRVVMNSAGLDQEEDLFAPVLPSAKRRGVWLGINMITVFMAAWVIGLFEEVLDKIVALAVLMPIVASMGGIAGSQTLTLTIRGLALDQIHHGNIRWLASKELYVGALNGLVWALIVSMVSFLWFWDQGIASIIGVAMVMNLVAAALSGVAIPIMLVKLGIDPALSGAVILTTVTDIIGFLSFLGLASLFLL
ncbi:MAG: magnesium transporter [Gammaproteobacteria bacterium]|nr:magnesium transporter [Gammaproteobacteria bacterium]NNJ98102.1 magnesium transporter [Gammaproteobacteria bacterium]